MAALLSVAGAANTAESYRHYCPWDPEVWPPGETLVFTLSTVHWPDDAVMTPDDVVNLLNEMLGEWAAIPSADISVRVEGTEANLLPGRDGRNIFYLNPDADHGTPVGQFWGSRKIQDDGSCLHQESDHTLGRPSMVRQSASRWDSPWHRIGNDFGMHPFGHLLGLEHAATFPTFRRCGQAYPTHATPDEERHRFLNSCPSDLAQWREVGGAWEVDPIMSYGQSGSRSFTETGGTLRLDDRIGVSLLRPAPGWLETTGTIEGSIRVEGEPVRGIHVWALQQTEGGLVDGVGAFTNWGGDFRIDGLPPGYWFLLAHPDPEWYAHPGFFKADQGDIRDVFLPSPVLTRAGAVTGGIEIAMSRGRSRNLLPAETR